MKAILTVITLSLLSCSREPVSPECFIACDRYVSVMTGPAPVMVDGLCYCDYGYMRIGPMKTGEPPK